MLTLTRDATEVIEQILETTGAPDGAGVRIAAAPPPSFDNGDEPSTSTLQVGLVEKAPEEDEVIVDHGARVFVEEAVVDLLSDKVLDARIVDERVQFTLGEQD